MYKVDVYLADSATLAQLRWLFVALHSEDDVTNLRWPVDERMVISMDFHGNADRLCMRVGKPLRHVDKIVVTHVSETSAGVYRKGKRNG